MRARIPPRARWITRAATVSPCRAAVATGLKSAAISPLVAPMAHAARLDGPADPVEDSNAAVSAVSGSLPSALRSTALTPSRPILYPLPSSPSRAPHPPTVSTWPRGSTARRFDPVPTTRSIPAPVPNASACAASTSEPTATRSASPIPRSPSSAAARAASCPDPAKPAQSPRTGSSAPAASVAARTNAATSRTAPPGSRASISPGPPPAAPSSRPCASPAMARERVPPPSTPIQQSGADVPDALRWRRTAAGSLTAAA